MIFEYFKIILGVITLMLYKVLYPLRITLKGLPKINSGFSMAIQKKSTLQIEKGFRGRDRIAFRIYNGGSVTIGENTFFNDGCQINCRKNVTIGKNVLLGQNVMIFDHDHDYRNNIQEFICKDVKIGDNVWIGANCIILRGVEIGDNCIIGAGTIVTKSVKSNVIMYQLRSNRIKEYHS